MNDVAYLVGALGDGSLYANPAKGRAMVRSTLILPRVMLLSTSKRTGVGLRRVLFLERVVLLEKILGLKRGNLACFE